MLCSRTPAKYVRRDDGASSDVALGFVDDFALAESKMSRLDHPGLVVRWNLAMQGELPEAGENGEAVADVLRPAIKENLIILADMDQIASETLQGEVDRRPSGIPSKKIASRP